jgi:hypothetical protein
MRFNRFLPFFSLLILVMLLAGCTTPATPAVPTATPVQSTATVEPTTTPAPTETLRPSLTPEVPPTEAPPAPPTATLPPTPDPALSKITLSGLAWYKNYDLLLSFQFPGPVDPQNYRVTLEDKVYTCEVLAKYPNRLYCRGQGAKVLTTANIRVYQAGSDQPGFEKDVWVPYFP